MEYQLKNIIIVDCGKERADFLEIFQKEWILGLGEVITFNDYRQRTGGCN